MESFIQRKKDVLSKKDKSSIGSWDKKIKGLCEKINKKDNFYTTSSCSGRIVLMKDNEKKQQGLFLKVYHDLISFSELKKDLIDISYFGIIKFKQEPCILHVACKSLEGAKFLMVKAKKAGWKKTSVISFSGRFIVELNSTERLEFLIMNKNKVLVDDDFLKLHVKKANENLKKTWKKISELKKLI
jgi:tRNA wybutosine-synthesizing protein 3